MKRSLTILAALSALVAAAPALAAVETLNAYENSQVTTSFDLVFPELGINSTSNVFYTRFELDIDAELGTARFVKYDQEIDSLAMPLGIQTGALTVRIVDSDGTYDPFSGVFVTNDTYEITFANDLSFFGFESPVLLPATSHGTITTDSDGRRTIQMNWEGQGELANSDNPAEPFRYTYTCRVNTVVAKDASEIPPVPTRFCADGLFSLFSVFGFALTFVGMKRYVRRR